MDARKGLVSLGPTIHYKVRTLSSNVRLADWHRILSFLYYNDTLESMVRM